MPSYPFIVIVHYAPWYGHEYGTRTACNQDLQLTIDETYDDRLHETYTCEKCVRSTVYQRDLHVFHITYNGDWMAFYDAHINRQGPQPGDFEPYA